VTFALSGLPIGATYSFSPASLAASSTGGTITGTINIPANVASNHPDAEKYAPLLAGLFLLPLLGIRRSRKRLGMLLMLILAGGMMSAMSGCSNSGEGILAQGQTATTSR
jgi:hypothetical protein